METGQEIFRALGMTLIHSLWQGAVIVALVLLMLMLTDKRNARARYGIHFAGLLLLLGSFVATFTIIYPNHQAIMQFQHAIQSDNRFNSEFLVSPVGILQMIQNIIDPFSIYIALGWFAGFILTGFRMAGAVIISKKSFSRDLLIPDSYLNDLFTDIRKTMGLPASIGLRISKRMISPLVTGIIWPMVIIPTAAVTGLTTEQIRSVIIHELAHIRRLDHIMVIIQAIARLVLFFHPLTWYLLNAIDRERENCCDDFVLMKNNNPLNYIKALAMIQEMNLQGAPGNALTGKSNQLLNRIKRLIKPESKHTATFRLIVTLVFILTVGVLSMAFIITGQPDLKSGKKYTVNVENVSDSPQLTGTVSTIIHDNKDGDKKKKMIIVFDSDTIREMTVNGKKLSKEEMKEYAGDIRKIQRELESSQEELAQAHQEMETASRELENAHRQFELANKEFEFNLDFNSEQMTRLQEQLNLELAQRDFDFKNFPLEFQSDGFQEKMMRALEEALKAFEDSKISQLESGQFQEQMKKAQEEMNKAFDGAKLKQYESEEFREKMKKAQEQALKAMTEAQKNHNEKFDAEEFREQMRKASEEARKAFEDLRKNGPDINFFPGIGGQEPPSPRPEINIEVEEAPEVPEAPEAPEAPEIEEEMEHPEIPEIQEIPEIERPENLEIEEKAEPNPRSEELNNTLQELENE
jgi:bla regulator protein BlaR1